MGRQIERRGEEEVLPPKLLQTHISLQDFFLVRGSAAGQTDAPRERIEMCCNIQNALFWGPISSDISKKEMNAERIPWAATQKKKKCSSIAYNKLRGKKRRTVVFFEAGSLRPIFASRIRRAENATTKGSFPCFFFMPRGKNRRKTFVPLSLLCYPLPPSGGIDG